MSDKYLNKLICRRIKEYRIQNGLTIEKLAYQSSISKGGLSEIEREMKEPKIETVLKICASLDIKINEFFDFKELNDYMNTLK